MSRNDEKRRLCRARHSSKSGRQLDRVVWDTARPPEHHTVDSKSEQITHAHTWTEVRIGNGELRGGEQTDFVHRCFPVAACLHKCPSLIDVFLLFFRAAVLTQCD